MSGGGGGRRWRRGSRAGAHPASPRSSGPRSRRRASRRPPRSRRSTARAAAPELRRSRDVRRRGLSGSGASPRPSGSSMMCPISSVAKSTRDDGDDGRQQEQVLVEGGERSGSVKAYTCAVERRRGWVRRPSHKDCANCVPELRVPNRAPHLTEKKRETWREYESGAGVDLIFSAFPSVDVMPATWLSSCHHSRSPCERSGSTAAVSARACRYDVRRARRPPRCGAP